MRGKLPNMLLIDLGLGTGHENKDGWIETHGSAEVGYQ
jgi:hypothetical protein